MVANGVITADQADSWEISSTPRPFYISSLSNASNSSCAIYLPWLLVTSKDLVDCFGYVNA